MTFAIDNDELDDQEPLEAGDTILCPYCFGMHVVTASEPPMVLAFRCGNKTYLAGVCGRSVMSIISNRVRRKIHGHESAGDADE